MLQLCALNNDKKTEQHRLLVLFF